jgi:hypothetical protein
VTAAGDERPCSFAVDYDCERRCQAEFDLTEVHRQFRLAQMLRHADAAHVEAHLAEPPVKVFRFHGRTVVRASVLGGAS